MSEFKDSDENAEQEISLIDLIVAPSGDLTIGKKYSGCLTIKVEFDKEKVLIIFPLIGDRRQVSFKEFGRYIDEKSGVSFYDLLKTTTGKSRADSFISKVYEVVDFVASYSFPLVKDMINFDDVVENYHVLYPYISFLAERGFIENDKMPGVYPATVNVSA